MFQEKLPTLSIRYTKSDKLRQTDCNEFLYNFVMKKAGQNLFTCLLCYVQPYLIWWLLLFIFLYVFQWWQHKWNLTSPIATMGSALPNLYMKHYESVFKILSNFQNVNSPCTNLIPYSRISGDGSSFQTSHLFTWQFSCVRFLPVWKSSKHANGEPNSDNHLGAFYVTCFAHGVWLFYSCGKQVATWSSRCALKSLCRHTYYIGAVCLFFWTQLGKNRCNSYEKRRTCVLSNISFMAISVGLPVAIDNPGFRQPSRIS